MNLTPVAPEKTPAANLQPVIILSAALEAASRRNSLIFSKF